MRKNKIFELYIIPNKSFVADLTNVTERDNFIYYTTSCIKCDRENKLYQKLISFVRPNNRYEYLFYGIHHIRKIKWQRYSNSHINFLQAIVGCDFCTYKTLRSFSYELFDILYYD